VTSFHRKEESDELSQIPIKVTKFHVPTRSNEVTKVATTPFFGSNIITIGRVDWETQRDELAG
jgi:hypothetical protein